MRKLSKSDRVMLLILVLAGCVVLALFVHGRQGEASAPRAAQATSSPTASATTPALDPDKVRLDARVQAFSRLYFSRGPQLSSAKIRASIRPFATAHFMDTAQFGYSYADADQAMVREQATLTVEPDGSFDAEYIDARTADGTIALRTTKKDRHGTIVGSPFTRMQSMTWVKRHGIWLVYDAPAT